MDLDNINDIEVLRKAAKCGRAQLKKDISSVNGDYIFKEGFWYFVEQDEYGVSIFSEDYHNEVTFTYEEVSKFLRRSY